MKKIIFAVLIIVAGFAVYYFFLRPGPRFIPPESAQRMSQFSIAGKIKNIEDKTIILETEDLTVAVKNPFEERPKIEKKVMTNKETVFKKINEKSEEKKSSFKDLKAEDFIFVLSEKDVADKNELTAKEIILMPKI